MKFELLEELYAMEIYALHDSELQALACTPRLMRAISSEPVREALQSHQRLSQQHLSRLKPLLRQPEFSPKIRASGMAGIIAELDDFLRTENDEPELRETTLIMAARKIEAHEIACYTGAAEVARMLGFDDDAVVLERTLNEELRMADLLSGLAAALVWDPAQEEADFLQKMTKNS